jgi:hypothetical protein
MSSGTYCSVNWLTVIGVLDIFRESTKITLKAERESSFETE